MEDLRCPQCENLFDWGRRMPKTLKCLHTFCVDCLKLDHTENGAPFVSCLAPSCGARQSLEPGQDLRRGLKTDYFIGRASTRFHLLKSPRPRCSRCPNDARGVCNDCKKLLCQQCSDDHGRADRTLNHVVKSIQEVLEEAKTARGDPIAPFTTKEKWACENHGQDEGAGEVRVYCFDCKQMLCVECAACDQPHHNKKPSTRVLEGNNEAFKVGPQLEELRQIRDDYARALDVTDREIEELDRACRLTAEAVEVASENLQSQLLAEKDALMSKVERIHSARVKEIKVKLKEFEESEKDVAHAIEIAKNTLECLPEDILGQEDTLVERLGQLCRDFQHHPLEPSQRDVFVFSVDPDSSLSGAVGSVYTNPDLNSLVEGLKYVPLQQGRKTQFCLACKDVMGSTLLTADFEVALVEVRPDVEMFPVVKNPNGTFTFSLKPRTPGEHSIHLEVHYRGKVEQIAPVTVFVSPTLLKEAALEKRIAFESIQGSIHPSAVALGERYMAISDKEAHRVFVLALDGQCVNVIGEEGINEGEFSSPQGLDWWGENLFVADTGNNRIQILLVGGEFLNCFGRFGGHHGEFMKPTDVAVSVSAGVASIYVADSINCRIQVFKMADIEGHIEPVAKFPLKNMPLSLCVGNNNHVFVTESLSNQFKVLTLKELQPNLGEALEEQSEPEPQPISKHKLELLYTCTNKENADVKLHHVRGITYDPVTQYVMVTEEDNPFVSFYNKDGAYMGCIKLPGGNTKLAEVSARDSCLVGIDSTKRAIFVLRLL